MTQMDAYERKGDLVAPLSIGKADERAQRDAERMRDATRLTNNVGRLSYEQMQAGQPCPGCGLPLNDDEPWASPGTMHMTPEERLRYEAEQARFKAAHENCRGGRWSMAGSLTTHCMKCCPPSPLSPVQVEGLSRLMSLQPNPSELMRWRLRLFCGHIIEKTAHASHRSIQAAFMGSTKCSECGLDPAVIVNAEPLGLMAESTANPVTTRADGMSPKPKAGSKAALQMQVEQLQAEVARLRAQQGQHRP